VNLPLMPRNPSASAMKSFLLKQIKLDQFEGQGNRPGGRNGPLNSNHLKNL
jgi:hypothetical protein